MLAREEGGGVESNTIEHNDQTQLAQFVEDPLPPTFAHPIKRQRPQCEPLYMTLPSISELPYSQH